MSSALAAGIAALIGFLVWTTQQGLAYLTRRTRVRAYILLLLETYRENLVAERKQVATRLAALPGPGTIGASIVHLPDELRELHHAREQGWALLSRDELRRLSRTMDAMTTLEQGLVAFHERILRLMPIDLTTSERTDLVLQAKAEGERALKLIDELTSGNLKAVRDLAFQYSTQLPPDWEAATDR